MAKKSLHVGICDYPYDGSDLNGCINDANDWAELLATHYGFNRTDMKMLTDAQATKAGMMTALKSLLAGAKAGDVLVFTNSSHGTYIADTSGDEARYDEAMCPYDCGENLIVDDELRELFAGVAAGVSLCVISDSCHSGTLTRVPLNEIPGMELPDDRRVRFLSPALRGAPVLEDPWSAKPKRSKYPQTKMKEVLLSGCTAREYSYDAMIDGKYHGAMTYFAIHAIREANYQLTYAQLVSRLNFFLRRANYPQHPQLEGSKENKKKPLFT